MAVLPQVSRKPATLAISVPDWPDLAGEEAWFAMSDEDTDSRHSGDSCAATPPASGLASALGSCIHQHSVWCPPKISSSSTDDRIRSADFQQAIQYPPEENQNGSSDGRVSPADRETQGDRASEDKQERGQKKMRRKPCLKKCRCRQEYHPLYSHSTDDGLVDSSAAAIIFPTSASDGTSSTEPSSMLLSPESASHQLSHLRLHEAPTSRIDYVASAPPNGRQAQNLSRAGEEESNEEENLTAVLVVGTEAGAGDDGEGSAQEGEGQASTKGSGKGSTMVRRKNWRRISLSPPVALSTL